MRLRLNFDLYGKKVINSSSLPQSRKEEIHEMWIKKSQTTNNDTINNNCNANKTANYPRITQKTPNDEKIINEPSHNYPIIPFEKQHESESEGELKRSIEYLKRELANMKAEYTSKINDMNEIIRKQDETFKKLIREVISINSKLIEQISNQKSNERQLNRFENKLFEINIKVVQTENNLTNQKDMQDKEITQIKKQVGSFENKLKELKIMIDKPVQINEKIINEQINTLLVGKINQKFLKKEELRQIISNALNKKPIPFAIGIDDGSVSIWKSPYKVFASGQIQNQLGNSYIPEKAFTLMLATRPWQNVIDEIDQLIYY